MGRPRSASGGGPRSGSTACKADPSATPRNRRVAVARACKAPHRRDPTHRARGPIPGTGPPRPPARAPLGRGRRARRDEPARPRSRRPHLERAVPRPRGGTGPRGDPGRGGPLRVGLAPDARPEPRPRLDPLRGHQPGWPAGMDPRRLEPRPDGAAMGRIEPGRRRRLARSAMPASSAATRCEAGRSSRSGTAARWRTTWQARSNP